MNKKYYSLILLGIGLFLLFPTDSFSAEAYTPIGENIWFILNPPTETRLGGIFASECPTGEFLHGVNTDGTLNCVVP